MFGWISFHLNTIKYNKMKDTNKEEPYIKRKPLKGQINRQVKFSNKSL